MEKQARRLGAFDYIPKPAVMAELVGTICMAWRRSQEVLKHARESPTNKIAAAAS
jgi:DNA-binding response OmpR family regulator